VTVLTESELREQLRRPRTGARVVVPPGAVLSPAARDFVGHWRLELVEEPQDAGGPNTGGRAALDRPGAPRGWDRPSTFPVVLEGETPRCVTCGGEVHGKPDGLTQLDACHFAPKTTPRIRLRGRIDSLQALALLAAARVAAGGNPTLARHLSTVAAYCRELLSAEYNERPAAPPELEAGDTEQVHRATHDPRGELGVDHLTPGADDPEALHWCNHLRCQVREVEVVALDTFPSPHHPYGASIVHGLNRLSSVVYYLELRLLAEGGTW
jgi:ethanolamine utilization cobalamin adenosyltransferase